MVSLHNFLSNFTSVFSLKVNACSWNCCHTRPLCIGEFLAGLCSDPGDEVDGADGDICGDRLIRGGDAACSDGTAAGSGDCGIAVKLKSLTDDFSMITLSLLLSSNRIFFFAVTCTGDVAFRFFSIDCGVKIGVDEIIEYFLTESGAGFITDN
jgi:hypothetical protein